MVGFIALIVIFGLLTMSFLMARALYTAAKSNPKKKSRVYKQPKKFIKRITFDYVNAKGEKTNRTVCVQKINEIYMYGYCEKRAEYRTFSVENISKACDPATGEIIENLCAHLSVKAA